MRFNEKSSTFYSFDSMFTNLNASVHRVNGPSVGVTMSQLGSFQSFGAGQCIT